MSPGAICYTCRECTYLVAKRGDLCRTCAAKRPAAKAANRGGYWKARPGTS